MFKLISFLLLVLAINSSEPKMEVSEGLEFEVDQFCARREQDHCAICYASFETEGLCTEQTTKMNNCLAYYNNG